MKQIIGIFILLICFQSCSQKMKLYIRHSEGSKNSKDTVAFLNTWSFRDIGNIGWANDSHLILAVQEFDGKNKEGIVQDIDIETIEIKKNKTPVQYAFDYGYIELMPGSHDIKVLVSVYATWHPASLGGAGITISSKYVSLTFIAEAGKRYCLAPKNRIKKSTLSIFGRTDINPKILHPLEVQVFKCYLDNVNFKVF